MDTKQLQKQVQDYLQACKSVFALMEEPNTNIFKFLQMLPCLDGSNTSAKRVIRTWYKKEQDTKVRAKLWVANMLTTQNAHFLLRMSDNALNVQTFLHLVKRASTNTEKALFKLNQINQLWQEKQTLCEF